MTTIEAAGHHEWLESELRRLVTFGMAARDARGGFGWLGDDGVIDTERPVELWISCRMTHVFALAQLAHIPGTASLVDYGVASLSGALRDSEQGGWFASIGTGGPVSTAKEAYAHAFVILAASSAAAAHRAGAEGLLRDALEVHTERFWDESEGMVRESFSRDWSVEEPYRGVNATMHTVEAYLAAADVLGDDTYLTRAVRMVTRVVNDFGRRNAWRLPEHFTPEWEPLLDYNADAPAHPFRPFGATIGHGLEWARLTLQTEQSLVARGLPAPAWMADAAASLYRTAVHDGWGVDGEPGFVYTVDWDGKPVVHQRMHWVVAEAICAAAALSERTSEATFARDFDEWWAYAREYLIDRVHGSWHHELDRHNAPASTVWTGKADLYHAVQATLIPRLPLAPSLATSLAGGLRRGA